MVWKVVDVRQMDGFYNKSFNIAIVMIKTLSNICIYLASSCISTTSISLSRISTCRR